MAISMAQRGQPDTARAPSNKRERSEVGGSNVANYNALKTSPAF